MGDVKVEVVKLRYGLFQNRLGLPKTGADSLLPGVEPKMRKRVRGQWSDVFWA